jgi:membrane protease YdiL (CAAX protease family)
MSEPRVWPIFAAYLLAFVSIVSFSLVAAIMLRAAFPDLSEREVFDGLPGVLAGGMASSAALLVTLFIVARPLDPVRLHLVPGRETGDQLVAMILGTLALGQVLDSATLLAGLANRGAMAAIRRAIESATGSELFAAVVVIGVLAGSAEEMFFRGYMQARLRERWPPMAAVVTTGVAFGLLHLEWLHASLALVLGLWLGFITERSGSALPAVAAHVINNVVFTVLTATVGTPQDRALNMALLAGSTVIFFGCAFWVWRIDDMGGLGGPPKPP